MSHFIAYFRSSEIDDLGIKAEIIRFLDKQKTAEYSDQNFYIRHYVDDFWPGNVTFTNDKSLTLAFGNPIIVIKDQPLPKIAALEYLDKNFRDGLVTSLTDAHGSFCGLHYDKCTQKLRFFTDKLGIRPIYIAYYDGFHVISTSFDFFTQCKNFSQERDLQGCLEKIVIGYSLADRTILNGVKRLLPAEVGLIDLLHLERSTYFSWISPIDNTLTSKGAVDLLNEKFSTAIRDHLQVTQESDCCAFLSGGMDSRLVVKSLIDCGANISTLNAAQDGSIDLAYGNMAAKYFKTSHHSFYENECSLGEAITKGVAHVRAHIGKNAGKLWWSGDGGSVSFGHVYLDERSCAAYESLVDLISYLAETNKWKISPRIFRNEYKKLAQMPLLGIQQEFEQLQAFPPEKHALLFFLFNDQRRHLDAHYEALPTKGFDLILPFFDDRVLSAILNVPSNFLIGHKVYNQLFAETFPSDHQIPWQAYPNHAPCPFVDKLEANNQWSDTAYHRANRKSQIALASNALKRFASGKTANVLNPFYVFIAAVITGLGIRDLRHVLITDDILKSRH